MKGNEVVAGTGTSGNTLEKLSNPSAVCKLSENDFLVCDT
jgi:hypothetical protein